MRWENSRWERTDVVRVEHYRAKIAGLQRLAETAAPAARENLAGQVERMQWMLEQIGHHAPEVYTK